MDVSDHINMTVEWIGVSGWAPNIYFINDADQIQSCILWPVAPTATAHVPLIRVRERLLPLRWQSIGRVPLGLTGGDFLTKDTFFIYFFYW